jgi:hypothetical protein
VKKILGVAVFGGLLLVLSFVFLGRGEKKEKDGIGADPASSGGLAIATAAASAAVPVVVTPPVAAVPAMSDTAACAMLAELCSTSEERVDAAACEKKLADARKMSGAANVDRSEQCLATAKTCAAATGCLSGGVGMGAVGEFLKGLGSAISK